MGVDKRAGPVGRTCPTGHGPTRPVRLQRSPTPVQSPVVKSLGQVLTQGTSSTPVGPHPHHRHLRQQTRYPPGGWLRDWERGSGGVTRGPGPTTEVVEGSGVLSGSPEIPLRADVPAEWSEGGVGHSYPRTSASPHTGHTTGTVRPSHGGRRSITPTQSCSRSSNLRPRLSDSS